MPLGDYLLGLGYFGVTWGAVAYAALTVERRRWLPRVEPAGRAMALGLVFLAALVGVHLLPGVFGQLNRETVAVTAALLGVAASRLPAAGAPGVLSPSPSPKVEGGRVSTALAGAAILAVCAFALAALAQVRTQSPSHVDAMSFALPGVAEWIRSGSIWDVGSFLPLIQVRTYPNSGDVLSLAAILPWSDDAFLRLTPVLLLAMIGAGVYAIGRELGASWQTAALAAAVALGADAVAVSALYSIKPDAFMLATFVGGMLFLLRNLRTGARSDLVLAGLGLGLAFGSRWYGITSVAAVLATWAAWTLFRRRALRAALGEGALLGAVVLAAGGFWLLRNFVLTGNPVYPVDVHPLGVAVFDAPRDVLTEDFGFSVTDRLGQPGFVRHQLLPALRTAFGLPGIVALGGVFVVAVCALRRGSGRSRLPFLLACVAALAIVYGFLPGGAQGIPAAPAPGIVEGNMRWLAPAFVLALCATAWGISHLPRGRVAAEAVVLVAAVYALSRAFEASTAKVVVAATVLILAWACALLLRRRFGRLPRPRSRVLVLVSAALFAAVLATTGYEHQRRYGEVRFADRSAIVDWVTEHASSGHRIGVAGYWSAQVFVPIYALFGPRLGNDVEYVGPVVRHQVRAYDEPGAFRQAVKRGGYDLLAIGLLEEPDFEGLRAQQTVESPPEARWAARAGYVQVARDGAFVLLARAGRGQAVLGTGPPDTVGP